MADRVHFIGIGGIGMSALAELMLGLGWRVQGSDSGRNRNIERLRGLGVRIFPSHEAAHIEGVERVVYSSAIGEDNVELAAAKKKRLEKKIECWHRARQLAELMRDKKVIVVAGTHGKTTVVALIAEILVKAGVDPTVINGGVMRGFGSNAVIGGGDWMVVEADESDGSFLRLPADIAVITNIDLEHIQHYRSLGRLEESFRRFLRGVSPLGEVIFCSDHGRVRRVLDGYGGRVLSYGLGEAAVAARGVRIDRQPACFLVESEKLGGELGGDLVRLPLWGEHNVLNALAAIAVALRLGVAMSVIIEALGQFSGVERRFSRLGFYHGAELYDDYAHHPVEIAAVLRAARVVRAVSEGRLIAILQPHRFSRLSALFDDFVESLDEADLIILTPVYAAGESERDVSHKTLGEELRRRGKEVFLIEGASDIPPLLDRYVRPKDIVIGMGAGSISDWMRWVARHV